MCVVQVYEKRSLIGRYFAASSSCCTGHQTWWGTSPWMLQGRSSSWCSSNGEAARQWRRRLCMISSSDSGGSVCAWSAAATVFVRPHTSAAPWMKSTDRRWELELAAPSVQTKAAWVQSGELAAVGDFARRDSPRGASACAANLSSTTTPRRSSIHGSCRHYTTVKI
jgi:hypothetical protein